jgi:hypothetical protein
VLPPGTITSPGFGNVVEAALDLDLKSDTAVFFATAGLASRLDVGIAVPYQRVTMDLRTRSTVRDFGVNVAPVSRVFMAPRPDFVSSGQARGISDIVRGEVLLTRGSARVRARGGHAPATGGKPTCWAPADARRR